jgi:hypothetical protein
MSKADNFLTHIGEATIKGLYNYNRGDPYVKREDDLNHRYYYSTGLADKFDDAKFKYTLSTRP